MLAVLLAGTLLVGTAVLAAEAADCEPRIVAVFDVGSGTTRMQVADIAECLNSGPRSLLRREVALGFAADLERQDEARFSDAMMQQATAALASLAEIARNAGAEELLGVATAAFRRAENAVELTQDWQIRFGLQLNIISQAEEARLAYRMIEIGLDDPSALVVWDIGAGSQQLVWRRPEDGRFEYFNSSLAAVTFRNLAMRELGRPSDAVTPNPIWPAEASLLRHRVRERVSAEVPPVLVALIRGGARVVGVGGVHGASLIGQVGLRSGDELSRSRLAEVLDHRLGLDDAAVGGAYADTQVTNLILVLELMSIYGIESYRATRADLTDALLVEVVDLAGRSVTERMP